MTRLPTSLQRTSHARIPAQTGPQTSQLQIVGMTVQAGTGAKARTLVDGVSLELNPGEVLALVGPSGSGKSLTCAASLDVLPAGTRRVAGRVCLDGVAQPAARLRGIRIASIMQNPRSAFNPVRTMRQHAKESAHALLQPARSWEARILAAMCSAGLDAPKRVLGLYPFEMSGGMLQRMMIALALASEAPFLFADEPTTDLDLIVQRDILDLLQRLVQEHKLGLLLITHDMGVVARLAHRVAVMDTGRVVETGPVQKIFDQPRHPVTCQLVDAHLSLYGLQRRPS